MNWRKLERIGLAPVRETHFLGRMVSGWFYQIPLARFRWGLKRQGVKAPVRRSPARVAPE